jgi:hypothetical protein
MTEAIATKSKPTSDRKGSVGRLFLLELSGGRIHSMNPDGSDRKVIVTDCQLPDGIAIDVGAGHIYWTNMGSNPGVNDGSIERADIDGKNRRMIVPRGATFTPLPALCRQLLAGLPPPAKSGSSRSSCT